MEFFEVFFLQNIDFLQVQKIVRHIDFDTVSKYNSVFQRELRPVYLFLHSHPAFGSQ